MDEKTLVGIENAIQTLAQADRILDGISELGGVWVWCGKRKLLK